MRAKSRNVHQLKKTEAELITGVDRGAVAEVIYVPTVVFGGKSFPLADIQNLLDRGYLAIDEAKQLRLTAEGKRQIAYYSGFLDRLGELSQYKQLQLV